MIPKEISNKVLTIGPYRKDGKGGISSVINNLESYYATFYFVSSTRSKRNPILMGLYFTSAIFRLLYYILIKRIKIVHIHGASYGSFVRKMVFVNIAQWFKVRVIYHIHGGRFGKFYVKYNKSAIIKRTINKADVLIVLSEKWKDFFSTITNVNKIYIINNPVNKPESLLTKNIEENNPIELLFFGLIGHNKGIFDLLDVMIKNKDAWEGKLLLHVGGNGETEKLEAIIEKEGLQRIVKFEGWVSGEKKIELLSQCDVYILPSYNEGLPVSILEAMSYGLPVISTPVGGIAEVIDDDVNGFLVEPGDKEAIENRIMRFLENRKLIQIMGEKHSAIIEDYYPEKVIPELRNIYKDLL